jgi:uncharacterized protein
MGIHPLEIIEHYFAPGSQCYEILICHGKAVAEKAIEIATLGIASENLDLEFIEEAAMLHDIGIFLTDTPKLGCIGSYPYVCHGYLGNQILCAMGFPKHGLVCERHVGVGISLEDIRQFNLPLPERDMRPVTLEEEIICYADKFHSKNGAPEGQHKTFEEIEKSLKAIGDTQWNRFREWALRFDGIRLE